MPKLQVSELSFRYEDVPLFQRLSFSVEEGEFVSILGPSGCGKSTVLNLLAGILTPESGEMRVDGQRIAGMNAHFAYMPQNDLLFPWKTIIQNVCLHAHLHGSEKAARERALELFPMFGLAGYENAYPGELSGGMRQRAAFARTVLTGSDLLLLDEPFSALDYLTRLSMREWLLEQWEQEQKTVLFITHDVEEALFLSSRILVVESSPITHLKSVPVPAGYPRTRDSLRLPAMLELKEQLIGLLRRETP